MRLFGFLLLLLAAGLFVASLKMDIAVSTSAGRVVNLHKLSKRADVQNASVGLGVIGALFFVFGGRRKRKSESPVIAPLVPTKKCPFCAEDVRVEAIKCKHFQADLGGALEHRAASVS